MSALCSKVQKYILALFFWGRGFLCPSRFTACQRDPRRRRTQHPSCYLRQAPRRRQTHYAMAIVEPKLMSGAAGAGAAAAAAAAAGAGAAAGGGAAHCRQYLCSCCSV
jgi:hypothetical protein